MWKKSDYQVEHVCLLTWIDIACPYVFVLIQFFSFRIFYRLQKIVTKSTFQEILAKFVTLVKFFTNSTLCRACFVIRFWKIFLFSALLNFFKGKKVSGIVFSRMYLFKYSLQHSLLHIFTAHSTPALAHWSLICIHVTPTRPQPSQQQPSFLTSPSQHKKNLLESAQASAESNFYEK